MGLDASKPDASSAPDGTFVVRGLQEGEYTASVSHDGYARRTAQGLAVKASGENLWPPIALQNGVAIVGVVRDSQAQPIPGAQVLGIALGDAVRPQIITGGGDGALAGDQHGWTLGLPVQSAREGPLQDPGAGPDGPRRRERSDPDGKQAPGWRDRGD